MPQPSMPLPSTAPARVFSREIFRYFPSSDFDWKSLPEVTIGIRGLPEFVETSDLFQKFAQEGNVLRIDLYEDRDGKKNGCGSITFRPPPERPFWGDEFIWDLHYTARDQTYRLRLELDRTKRIFKQRSLIDPNKSYPERITLVLDSIRFGFMKEETTLMVMTSAESTPMNSVFFVLDLQHRKVEVLFPMRLGHHQHYKIEISLQQMVECWEVYNEAHGVGLVIPLKDPPKVFRRSVDPLATHAYGAKHWHERFSWFRQTEIVQDRSAINAAAVSLGRQKLDIDIGRWTVYWLGINQSQADPSLYSLVRQILQDYNIKFRTPENVKLAARQDLFFPSWLQNTDTAHDSAISCLKELESRSIRLNDFAVRYQLEVCLSRNCLNESNFTEDFLRRLAAMDSRAALDLLEHVAELDHRFYNPFDIFDLQPPRGTASRKSPEYCYLAYTATVTPSSIYFATPILETSNRVIRQYKDYKDRFLRVRFADENSHGRINSQDSHEYDAVFTRVKRTLINGITIGDRHFDFLAFGNSQIREHGAYFFSSPTPALTSTTIRAWMGDFRPIKVVAKCASRIGQCFSTTRAINGTKVQIREIEDVKSNGYIFTDGVGKISKFLAQMVASELKLKTTLDDPPSLFQFRLGGCKGVLALAPEIGPREVHIRPSQYKFAAIHEGLEIIRTSSFAVATLNQQLVTILSTLGIEDEVFQKKQTQMLQELEQAMKNEAKALNHLQRQIDPNQMTLTIGSIMLDGFMRAQDPFAVSLLHLWRAWTVKYLKEKARIVIDKGAFLLGCIDETGTLKGHRHNIKLNSRATFAERLGELPEIVIQVPHPSVKGEYVFIEGICVVGRNPSLHPGDLRVVRAVKNLQLSHLRNVVVFPRQGDRDIPSMCSGGDLDGDDYFVFWDPELIPPEWNYKPMDHQGPKPEEQAQDVTVDQICNHFVNFMKNDKLARIANAWLANADWLEQGAESEICRELAELHSVAVDYPKSGIPAIMPRRLIATRYPHFMENLYRPKEKTYTSNRVLGKLFDQVQMIDFAPLYHLPFDDRILNAHSPSVELLNMAHDIKIEYDAAMRRIMAQHQIETEFEVWTTFVLRHANFMKKYDSHEVMARHGNALREQFQQVCFEKAGGNDFTTLAPFIVAMYAVTAQEVKQFITQYSKNNVPTAPRSMISFSSIPPGERPFISFPWLFQVELGKIANGVNYIIKESVKQQQNLPQSPLRVTALNVMDIDLIDLHAGLDDVETSQGITHRGELLELFQELDSRKEGENFTGESLESSKSVVVDDQLLDFGGGHTVFAGHQNVSTGHENAFLNEDLISLDPVNPAELVEDAIMVDMDTDRRDDRDLPEEYELEDGELVELEMDDGPSALEKLALLLQG